MTQLDSPAALTEVLARHGIRATDPPVVEELSGGISCRVLRVCTDDGDVVVKQALPELRVAGEWRADVARAQTEAECGAALSDLVPGSCPRVLASDPAEHAFVMAAAPTGSVPWKQQLIAGEIDAGVARWVGRLLGLVHSRAASREDLRSRFADRTNFRALRLEPYLDVTRRAHPDLDEQIQAVIAYLDAAGTTLVHGDASPKNILVTPDGEVLIIDHEVAHWGRPAFDTAFVVNHLCLKAFYRPEQAGSYLQAAETLLGAYAEAAGDGSVSRDESALVLAPLLLARIDGRSQVEYLEEDQRARVREVARAAVAGRLDLDEIFQRVQHAATRA